MKLASWTWDPSYAIAAASVVVGAGFALACILELHEILQGRGSAWLIASCIFNVSMVPVCIVSLGYNLGKRVWSTVGFAAINESATVIVPLRQAALPRLVVRLAGNSLWAALFGPSNVWEVFRTSSYLVTIEIWRSGQIVHTFQKKGVWPVSKGRLFVFDGVVENADEARVMLTLTKSQLAKAHAEARLPYYIAVWVPFLPRFLLRAQRFG